MIAPVRWHFGQITKQCNQYIVYISRQYMKEYIRSFMDYDTSFTWRDIYTNSYQYGFLVALKSEN